MLYAKKGDKMQCANCNNIVYEFIEDIQYGDPIEASQVKGINGNGTPIDGDKAECPYCENNLILGGHNVVR